MVVTDLETVSALPAATPSFWPTCSSTCATPPPPGLVTGALRDDGHVFISVPNIANITVRLGLLFGIFEYRDRGILDKTHLRFYTKRTILREVEKAGFRILAVRGSSVPIRLSSATLPEPLLRLGERC